MRRRQAVIASGTFSNARNAGENANLCSIKLSLANQLYRRREVNKTIRKSVFWTAISESLNFFIGCCGFITGRGIAVRGKMFWDDIACCYHNREVVRF